MPAEGEGGLRREGDQFTAAPLRRLLRGQAKDQPREINATLATWFGVSACNLFAVLPNIGRFAKPDLGFIG